MDWTQALTIIGTTLGTTIGFYILIRSDITRLDEKWEGRFLSMDEKWESKFLAFDEKWEGRFLAMDEKWERLFDRIFIDEKRKS